MSQHAKLQKYFVFPAEAGVNLFRQKVNGMKRTTSTIVNLLFLFVSVSVAAETPVISAPPQGAAAVPATPESVAEQAIKAPASDVPSVSAQAEAAAASVTKPADSQAQATPAAVAQAVTAAATQTPDAARANWY